MSAQLLQLESLLQQLVVEHEKLLKQMDRHQAAMKALDLTAMDEAARQQEACRTRIAGIEGRRRSTVAHLAGILRIQGAPTVAVIAAAAPDHFRPRLLATREQLVKAMDAVSPAQVTIGGRLAGALLGHLNTAVRLISGAVEQAGTYTKHGVPRVSARIGVMEAVG